MYEIQRQVSENLKPLPKASDLRFGHLFTDHWFFSKYKEELGWYESRVEPYGTIALDPAASVLHYSQTLFEGMKAFRQPDGSISLFRPEFNIRRMQQGAERLCLPAVPVDLFNQGLKELLTLEQRWVPEDEGCTLYIRPTLIGTEPFLGVRPSKEVLFFILLSPVGSYYASGAAPVKIWVEGKALRAAPGGLGATKAGANYAASLQAAQNAKSSGYAQVLWLDVEHEGIEEVGTMNVFFVFKDEIVTPALNGSILAGNVRDSVIQLLKSQGQPIRERRITMTEILERHASGELLETFGTGTAAVISPVGEFQYKDKTLVINDNQPGPVSQELFKTLTGVQRGKLEDKLGWMVPLKDL